MSCDSSSDSFEDHVSLVFDDPQPISYSLSAELGSYAQILLDFRRPTTTKHDNTSTEDNKAALAGAVDEEAIEVLGEDPQVDISAVESGASPAPLPPTTRSRRMRKRKTEEEKEEFWSRRPDWLPQGWTTKVKVRENGATKGLRDRYYYEPRTGHQFRSRKEVEKFIQTGEAPSYKPKPKAKESHILHTLSQSSEPTPSSSTVWPLTLEFYSRHLPSFMSGGRSNQQFEVGATIIGHGASSSSKTAVFANSKTGTAISSQNQ